MSAVACQALEALKVAARDWECSNREVPTLDLSISLKRALHRSHPTGGFAPADETQGQFHINLKKEQTAVHPWRIFGRSQLH